MHPLLTIYTYFIIYSFLGWVCESIYCSILDRRLVNRGFVSGPFCPIYGVGALVILKILTPFSTDVLTIFLVGMILTSLVEYISSYLLEKTFQTKWWDYSTYPFNIRGRVCLKNSLMFGALSVMLNFVIHPRVSQWIAQSSIYYVQMFALLFTIFFAFDFGETVYSILKLNDRLKLLENLKMEAMAKYEEFGQEFGLEAMLKRIREVKDLAEFNGLEEILTRFRNNLIKLKFSQRRLLRAFPKMRSLTTPYIQAMRDFINERKNNE